MERNHQSQVLKQAYQSFTLLFLYFYLKEVPIINPFNICSVIHIDNYCYEVSQ